MNRDDGLALLRGLEVGDRDPTAWIARLDERETAGEKLSVMQRTMREQGRANLVSRVDTEALRAASTKRVAAYAAERGIAL